MIVEQYSEERVKKQICKYIREAKLIPIIGAGFSKGCRAKEANVLDGDELKEKMIKLTLKNSDKFTEESLRTLELGPLSARMYKVVAKEEVTKLLNMYFTKVKLTEYRKKFLQLPWRYIYTLNIDDGIEKNSDFVPILPYKKLSQGVKDNVKCVFKMHGDVNHETIYPEEESIIFSKEHYIKSLEKNKCILKYFQADYSSNNILFIGCSLRNELDLEYIIATNSNLNYETLDRYYLTTEIPDENKLFDLEELGINKILLIDDYEKFYEEIYTDFLIEKCVDPDEIDEFRNPSIDNIQGGVNENLPYLLANKAVYYKNKFIMPDFLIEREKVEDIIRYINENECVLVCGRRVSGKTYLLLEIVNKIKNKDVYFFPSSVSLSNKDIGLLMEKHNTVFIFDSNSLSFENAKELTKHFENVKDRGNSIIIGVNTSDRVIFALFAIKKSISYVELSAKLEKKEVERLNDRLSSLGIAKIKEEKNFLDNVFYLSSEVYKDKKSIDIDPRSGKGYEELTILILLAATDKIYYSMLDALDIDYAKVDEILSKYPTIIQKEYISFVELEMHSTQKIVVNSKAYLLEVLKNFVEYNGVGGYKKIAKIVYDIVEKLEPFERFKDAYRSLILFDTLNQIFPKKQGGVRGLIFEIYDALESLLYNENHYWLQRAKSILYLKGGDEKELLKGVDYGKKAFYDADIETFKINKLQENSSLTIAMLYGRLSNLKRLDNIEYVKQSIEWYYYAMKSPLNGIYINNMLKEAYKKTKTNDFYNLYTFMIENQQVIKEHELREKMSWIINFFINECNGFKFDKSM